MESDPHLRRLNQEHTKLDNLARRSRGRIEIDPVEVVPGMPPDKYIITFNCKGIKCIDDNKEPVADYTHKVSMYITREFPQEEPFLIWLTPIWHPNIAHKKPRHVCTNKVKNFFSSKGLDDYVLMLGEMVQYKRYHALPIEPLPRDQKVADWVLDYAEPRGIVGPDKPFDPDPLVREYEITVGEGSAVPSPAPPAVKEAPPDVKETPPPPPVKREGITLGARRILSKSAPATSEPVRMPGIMFGARRRT